MTLILMEIDFRSQHMPKHMLVSMTGEPRFSITSPNGVWKLVYPINIYRSHACEIFQLREHPKAIRYRLYRVIYIIHLRET
jgi:hypothetical protein